MRSDMLSKPEQPNESDWLFIEDLKQPMYKSWKWEKRKSSKAEVYFGEGVNFCFNFPDNDKLLETAYSSIKRLMKLGSIPLKINGFRIITEKKSLPEEEMYRIEVVSQHECKIISNDTEGMRRGIFYLEDMLLHSGGPFLSKGIVERRPQIKVRISRCSFGPIKRPPKNKDELCDNVNYYPEEYLNRLAHHGINGLWLTINFKDLCPSRFFPEFGNDRERRLEKLRQTVMRCRKHGIQIFPFCIEPCAFGHAGYLKPVSLLEGHPYFFGHRDGDITYFCTSSREGQEYLEEATYFLFSQVPYLGGLININYGERATHCYSGHLDHLNCPRCSKRKPWEVFYDIWMAMARGIHKAAPDAKMISWLYVPCITTSEPSENIEEHIKMIEERKNVIKNITSHAPKDIILQMNYESLGEQEQLGKMHTIFDYSLSYAGPSRFFADCAGLALKNGAGVAAKIQTTCSHEVATLPYLPVPGNLYKKYISMHKLGVNTVMQCWYFGGYVSMMTKAAGELSFSPIEKSEDEFLLKLAELYWGNNAAKVVKAWKYFQESYSCFPSNLAFSYYGPLHDAIAWPLYLKPVDKEIAPSWLLKNYDSGDRIGECICFEHSLKDIITLCKKMSALWSRGMNVLDRIRGKYRDNHDQLLDIGVAEALGLQMKSAYNLFRFYAFREVLPYKNKNNQLTMLYKMRKIVKDEIKNTLQLHKLAIFDTRLGFHSEAEGYKYFPAKLEWRVKMLNLLLKNDFIEVENMILKEMPIFPEYTGMRPQEPMVRCGVLKRNYTGNPWSICWEDIKENNIDQVETVSADSGKFQTSFSVVRDTRNLYVFVKCHTPLELLSRYVFQKSIWRMDRVILNIESLRLWPLKSFYIGACGEKYNYRKNPMLNDLKFNVYSKKEKDIWSGIFEIPFETIKKEGFNGRPFRFNIERHIPGQFSMKWIKAKRQDSRLLFSNDDHKSLGWLIFN